ncbi:MAG TPA: YkvA family protein [Anaerolineales bacterium]|nr:DUF1232 domain-containing protein [Anaerolineales bacterium]HMS01159.1 YkvA family protein [Anaerolineales bacterium]HNQ95101.1 YkvA family protein [Anaerolineales bacterium]HNS60765.1 YkvA family protein [Anaerolineales bacterium]
MTDKRPNKIMVPPQGGMLRDLVTRLKLIGRLMSDRRVNFFLKILPLASVAYLFWPLDAIAIPFIGVLDDAAILWIGSTLFVELCPPNVVEEHVNELASNYEDDSTDDVVDAESTDVDGK